MRLLVVLSVAFFLACSSAQASGRNIKVHRDAELGIQFVLPASWRIRPCVSQSNCIEVGPGLLITVVDGDLDGSIAQISTGLEKTAQGWVKWGRQTQEAAQTTVTENGTAILGTGDCLVSDEQGDHTGSCTEALFTNGKRTAHLESEGLIESKAVAQVVNSLKFLHPTN